MDCLEIKDVKTLKGIKMVHLNVRSLFNKMEQIWENFKYMDVILISETWLGPAVSDAAISLPGYNLIRQDRNYPGGKRGGGLCVYIKTIYKMDFLDGCFNQVTEDFELIGISLKHPHIKPFNIIGIYRPPSGKPQEFVKYLNNNLTNLVSDRRESFLLGDVNINYAMDQVRNNLKLDTLETKIQFDPTNQNSNQNDCINSDYN